LKLYISPFAEFDLPLYLQFGIFSGSSEILLGGQGKRIVSLFLRHLHDLVVQIELC